MAWKVLKHECDEYVLHAVIKSLEEVEKLNFEWTYHDGIRTIVDMPFDIKNIYYGNAGKEPQIQIEYKCPVGDFCVKHHQHLYVIEEMTCKTLIELMESMPNKFEKQFTLFLSNPYVATWYCPYDLVL